MPKETNQTATSLFKDWRSGNAEAGQHLAQRVSDWFYAVCSSRFGEAKGNEVFQATSQKFGEGIVSVAHSSDLVTWAHTLLNDEIKNADAQTSSEDRASPYSGGHPPGELLSAANAALPSEVKLLAAFYGGESETDVDSLALDLGGMPGALLHARYSVKSWLKNEHSLPFEIVPESPNIDLIPLPMYEATRMVDASEVTGFEQWMLDNKEICQDIAEFAPFASALRGGIQVSGSQRDGTHTQPVQSTEGRLKLRVADLALILGIFMVLISFFAFAFIVAFSME